MFYTIKPLFTDKWMSVNEFIDSTRETVYAKNRPPFCPVCKAQLSRYLLKPLEFNFVTAKPFFCDIVFNNEFLFVSDVFKKAYESSGLRGIREFREISISKISTHNGVRKAKLPLAPRYFLTDIVVDGAIDLKKSNAVIECPHYCEYCMNPVEPFDEERPLGLVKWEGFIIDRRRWHGNNIFKPVGLECFYAVDEKFREWFESTQLKSGCDFVLESEDTDDWLMRKYRDNSGIYLR